MLHKLVTLITTVLISLFGLQPQSPKVLSGESFIANKEPELIEDEFIPQLPSLEKIFSQDHDWTATLSAEKLTTIMATGDVILARSVNFQSTVRKNFRWPFEKTADFLKTADITLINLESPLTPNCPLTNKGMIFCGDEKNLDGLLFAEADIATLENNHIENYGLKGVENTIMLLEQSGIYAVRSNKAVYKDVKGIKFAFLSYNDLKNPQNNLLTYDIERMTKEIEEAKKSAEIAAVSFHWGAEYTRQPAKRQINLAHLAIDAGADLIIGNHPHWIQPVEIYKDKLVIYSHGNFVFDQMWSEETKEGVIGEYTFYINKLIDAEFFPIYIQNYGQPTWPDLERKEKILTKMKETSMDLKNYNMH